MVIAFGGVAGSSSFPAAGSGGPIIDFDAISEPDGWVAMLCWSAAGFADETGSDELAAACLSCLLATAALSATAGAVVVTGAAMGAGVGFTAKADGSIEAVVAGAVVAGEAV
jgi:hypothetical protein